MRVTSGKPLFSGRAASGKVHAKMIHFGITRFENEKNNAADKKAPSSRRPGLLSVITPMAAALAGFLGTQLGLQHYTAGLKYQYEQVLEDTRINTATIQAIHGNFSRIAQTVASANVTFYNPERTEILGSGFWLRDRAGQHYIWTTPATYERARVLPDHGRPVLRASLYTPDERLMPQTVEVSPVEIPGSSLAISQPDAGNIVLLKVNDPDFQLPPHIHPITEIRNTRERPLFPGEPVLLVHSQQGGPLRSEYMFDSRPAFANRLATAIIQHTDRRLSGENGEKPGEFIGLSGAINPRNNMLTGSSPMGRIRSVELAQEALVVDAAGRLVTVLSFYDNGNDGLGYGRKPETLGRILSGQWQIRMEGQH